MIYINHTDMMSEMIKKEEFLFSFSFFLFMYGIYPYAFVTEKQKESMEKAEIPFEYMNLLIKEY